MESNSLEVVGDDLPLWFDDADEPDAEEASSPSSSPREWSMRTSGIMGFWALRLKLRGFGRLLATAGGAAMTAGGEGERSLVKVGVGGLIFTASVLAEDRWRKAFKAEFPFEEPRRHEEAESDLDGATTSFALLEAMLPREVPPLMTVVPGMLVLLVPNLPSSLAVIGIWSMLVAAWSEFLLDG